MSQLPKQLPTFTLLGDHVLNGLENLLPVLLPEESTGPELCSELFAKHDRMVEKDDQVRDDEHISCAGLIDGRVCVTGKCIAVGQLDYVSHGHAVRRL